MDLTYKQQVESSVSRETFESINKYINLLKLWNRKIALISNHLNDEELYKHIMDAISLREHIKNKDALIIDVGSGNGLLGIILAIIGYTNCNLVEINGKKAIFLLEMKRELNIDIKIHHRNISELKIDDIGGYADYVVTKAFGDIKKILINTVNLSNKRTKILILKSKDQIKNEIKITKESWTFDYKIYYDINDAKKVIIELVNFNEIVQ